MFWILFLLLCSNELEAQDMECTTASTCNQVTLTHSVQVKTHCVFPNIRFNNMSEDTITVGIFRLCRNTLILDMSNNGIRHIKAGAFLGLSALNELYLANNLIDRIEAGTFHTLTDLKVFVLTSNKITTVPEYEFTSREMRFFNINNNMIRHIPQTALLNLQNPELVDLSLNDLDILDPVTLSNVRSGVKVVLNNNRLHTLAMLFNVTLKSKHTSILEATGNSLTALNNGTLGEFYKLRLVSLDLSFNHICEIDIETFDAYTTLNSIYLSHNRISVIHPELFKMVTNLHTLDLSYNQLTHAVFAVKLPEPITTLNYSNNRIQLFPDYHWSSKLKRRVMFLDISNNSISYLDGNRFCSYMSHVNLGYNKWRCSVLYAVVHTLSMRGVMVTSGSDFYNHNVNGIPCDMRNSKWFDMALEDVKGMLNKPDHQLVIANATEVVTGNGEELLIGHSLESFGRRGNVGHFVIITCAILSIFIY